MYRYICSTYVRAVQAAMISLQVLYFVLSRTNGARKMYQVQHLEVVLINRKTHMVLNKL